MATTLTVNQCTASVGWSYSSSTTYSVSSANTASFSYSDTFSNGTGAAKAQKIWAQQLTLSAGDGTDYDLDAGTMLDPFGTSVTFGNIKVIFVQHQTTTATGVVLVKGDFMAGDDASPTQPLSIDGTRDGTKDGINIKPGGCLFLSTGNDIAAGYTVTATSADQFRFENKDAASVTVKVVLIGE